MKESKRHFIPLKFIEDVDGETILFPAFLFLFENMQGTLLPS